MKNVLMLGVLLCTSISAYAQKNCSLNINARTYLDNVSKEEVMTIATQLAASTDIQLVQSNSDYMMEIYANHNIDHHNTRYAYINGDISIWPSQQIKDRSAFEVEFGTEFRARRKLTKAVVIKLVTNALEKQLKSCDGLDKAIKSNGNGTLTPVNGDLYTTKTGATFERVGTYWKDPSGLMWGEILDGEYANASVDSPAVKACEELGARLPTADEYNNLMSYFSQSSDRNHRLSTEGKFEFNALFPWSFGMYTTATRDANGVGHDFHHIAGSSSRAMAHWELNVRCVK